MTLHRGTRAALAVLAGAGLLLACAAARAEEKKDDSGKPPKGATVLFDGKDLSDWVSGDGKPAEWKVEDGYVEVARARATSRPRTPSARTSRSTSSSGCR